MSVSRLSDECAGMDAEFVFGHVKIEPDHKACSGGHTRPGVLGGWVCSCECHLAAPLSASSAHTPPAQGGTGEHLVIHPDGRMDVAGPEAS